METLNGRVALDCTVMLDCDDLGTRAVNHALRSLPSGSCAFMRAPRGRHNLAVGLATEMAITVDGNAGYFLGGLCGAKDGSGPEIVVNGFVGWSVGENLMGGSVRVRGARHRARERAPGAGAYS